MRTLSQREVRLAVITAAVVITGLTWWGVKGRILRLGELRDRREGAHLEQLRQQGMMRKRPVLNAELQTIRGQLPRHPEGKDLKSEFARQVQALAGQSGLQLTSLTPEPEEDLEELGLHRSAVQGDWTGTPEAVVSFLVRLQQLGPVSDIEDLRIRRRAGNDQQLSGSFELEFVYVRIPDSETEVEIDTPLQSPNDGDTE